MTIDLSMLIVAFHTLFAIVLKGIFSVKNHSKMICSFIAVLCTKEYTKRDFAAKFPYFPRLFTTQILKMQR